MHNEEKVLKELRSFTDAFKKAYSTSGSINARQQTILNEFNKLKETISDPNIKQSLDSLLEQINSILEDENLLAEAQTVLRTEKEEFFGHEKSIRKFVQIKDQEIKRAIEEAANVLSSIEPNSGPVLRQAMPRNTEEMLNLLESYTQSAVETLSSSMDLTRTEKKAAREDEKYRLWLATTGTVLSVGNVLLSSLTGLGAVVAGTSITTGTACVGAAARMPISQQ